MEHQLEILPDNLENGYYISGWSFITDSEGIELSDISNSCELVYSSNGKSKNKDCTASQEKNENTIKLSYKFEMYSTDKLIVTYKYKKRKRINKYYINQSRLLFHQTKVQYIAIINSQYLKAMLI